MITTILSFLLALEEKVERNIKKGKAIRTGKYEVLFFNDKNKKKVEVDYKNLRQTLAPYEKKVEKRPSKGKLISAGFDNLIEMGKNAFYNTAGVPIAHVQNWKTNRELQKNPQTKKYEIDLIHGWGQNIGSQVPLAKKLKKAGYLPYHQKAYNGLDEYTAAEQIKKDLENKDKRTNATPNRILSGHSNGSLKARIIAEDEQAIKKYNIKAVQARAPSVHGVYKTETLGQKMLIPFVGNDNTNKTYGKAQAVQRGKKRPKVPYYVALGEYDGLVTPTNGIDKYATSHSIFKGKDTTHFKTAGGHSKANKMTVDHLDHIIKDIELAGKNMNYTGKKIGSNQQIYNQRQQEEAKKYKRVITHK